MLTISYARLLSKLTPSNLLIEAAKQLPDLTFDFIVQQFDSSKVNFVAIISLEIATSEHVKVCSAEMHSGLRVMWNYVGLIVGKSNYVVI